MAITNKSPAKRRKFCVWADDVQRVYQDVEAGSPTEAYAIAEEQPDNWISTDFHDNNGYQLSSDVQDLETGEFIRIQPKGEKASDEPLRTLEAITNDCEAWFGGKIDMSAADLLTSIGEAADAAIESLQRVINQAHGR
jgi:hypothetical protein